MKANATIRNNLAADEKAVSPVVATLLLVLVAAGAAIGFGVFLNGFQSDTQDNVSSDAPVETLRIGGSSTVWELNEKVAPAFQAAHPTIKVDNQEGGSGAGKVAICKGLVDIGTSSSGISATGSPGQDLASCPDFNGDGTKDIGQDLHVVTVGYDAVVLAYSASSTGCGTFALDFTPAQIKELYAVNGGNQPHGNAPTATDGAAAAAGATTLTSAGNQFTPAMVGKVAFGANLPTNAVILSVASGGGSAVISRATTGAVAAASVGIFASGPTADTNTHYAWADLPGCTGTPLATAVVLGSRSDQGGTEDGFCSKFFGSTTYGGKKACVSGTNQLEDTIFTNVNPQLGNDGIRNWLKATPAAGTARMSFIGYGSVAESGSGLGTGTMMNVAPSASNIKAAGAKTTACAPIETTSSQFCAARSLVFITAGKPSGTEQLYIDFVMQTLNNINYNKAAGYVSIYA